MKLKLNGEEHGGTLAARNRKLRAYYEAMMQEVNPDCPNCMAKVHLKTLDDAQALLDQAAATFKQQNGNGNHILQQALQLDAARRDKTAGNLNTQRARTAELLKTFSRTKPSRPSGNGAAGVGPLITHGYLMRKGDGYVRTAKPYHVSYLMQPARIGKRVHQNGNGSAPTKTRKKRSYGADEVNARRAITAAFLSEFDQTTPREFKQSMLGPNMNRRAVGALVLGKYLKHKGDGYIRTAKPFEVDIRKIKIGYQKAYRAANG